MVLNSNKVKAVENGRQARDELLKEDSHYDLVLLDLMMPEMVFLNFYLKESKEI